METRVIERLSVEINLGMSKAQSKYAPLSSEMSSMWDRMKQQMDEIHAMGGTINIVSEIPEVEIGKVVE